MIIRDLIAQLTVKADTNKVDRFNRGVDKSKTKLNKASTAAGGFSSKIKGMGMAFKGFIAVVAGSAIFKTLITGYTKSADAIGKFSTATGISTQSLQENIIVYAQGGASQEEYMKTQEKLIKNRQAALDGSKKAVEAFKQLNISQKELKTLKIDELNDRVAAGLRKISKQADRAAAAEKVLGKASIKTLPTMMKSAEELQKAREEARKTGGILTPQQIKDAEKFSDTLAETKLIVKGMANQLSAALLPPIIKLLEKFNKWIKEGDNLKKTMKRLKIALSAVAVVLSTMGIYKAVSSMKSLAIGAYQAAAGLWAQAKAGLAAKAATGGIILLLAGLVLVGRELYKWYTGKGSIFDEFLDNEAGEELRETITEIKEEFKKLWVTIKPVLKKIGTQFAEIGKKILKLFKKILPAIFILIKAELFRFKVALIALNAIVEAGVWLFDRYVESLLEIKKVAVDLKGPLQDLWKEMSAGTFLEDTVFDWNEFKKVIWETILEISWYLGALVGAFTGTNRLIAREIKKIKDLFLKTKLGQAVKTAFGPVGLVLKNIFSLKQQINNITWLIKKIKKLLTLLDRLKKYKKYLPGLGLLTSTGRAVPTVTQASYEPSKAASALYPPLPGSPAAAGAPTTVTNHFKVTVAVDGSVDMSSEDFNEKLKEGATKVFADIVQYEYMTRVPA